MPMGARFTGTLGGGGQNVFNSTAAQKDDPFGAGTAVPKPNSARRLGTSFTGGIARPQPRAAGSDPSFGSINLSNQRQQFGRLGERAANQDITNENIASTQFNADAKASKEAEISAYDKQVTNLNTAYGKNVADYNKTISDANERQKLVDAANAAADAYNTRAATYRASRSYGLRDGLQESLDAYSTARTQLNDAGADENLYGGFQNFQQNQGGGYTLMPIGGSAQGGRSGSPYDTRYFQVGGPRTVEGTRLGNLARYTDRYTYDFGDGLSGWGSTVRDVNGHGMGRAVYNPFSNSVANLFESGPQNPGHYDHYYHDVTDPFFTANVPYAYGGYNPTETSETSWFDAPDAPDRPGLPDAPDPVYEQKQMKEMLADRVERRLGPGQREIVGGDLPPQVADQTGDAFGVSEVTQGGIDYRELGELNASERKNLGAPKAWSLPQSYWTAKGQHSYYGGGTFTPSDIGNETDDSYFFKGYGWVKKSQLTPLY